MKFFNYIAGIGFLALALIGPAFSSAPSLAPQTEWVAASLKEMQTIKVGMTRGQLLKVFTEEGGLSSRTYQLYVYQKCPYFKVRVQFKPIGKDMSGGYSLKDQITQISEPFLQEPTSN